jgi:hypothetical protein
VKGARRGTGLWLIYLTFAAVLNFASGTHLPLRAWSAAACGRGGPADRVEDRERIEVVAPVRYLSVDDR